MRVTRIRLDCDAIREPDLAAIDQIARLQLTCRQCSCELRLANASVELAELIGLTGLGEVLRLEPGREPEEREQAGGVEEEGELGDLPT